MAAKCQHPVEIAAAEGHFGLVVYYCERIKVFENTIGCVIPQFYAAKGGHLRILKYLVEQCHVPIDVTAFDKYAGDDATLQDVAGFNGHEEVVAYLMMTQPGSTDRPFNPLAESTSDRWGTATPLLRAVREQHTELVKTYHELLTQDPNSGYGGIDHELTDDGWTMLHIAVSGSNTKLAQWAVLKGANVERLVNAGISPRDLAFHGECDEAVGVITIEAIQHRMAPIELALFHEAHGRVEPGGQLDELAEPELLEMNEPGADDCDAKDDVKDKCALVRVRRQCYQILDKNAIRMIAGYIGVEDEIRSKPTHPGAFCEFWGEECDHCEYYGFRSTQAWQQAAKDMSQKFIDKCFH
jgi:Ankyrin repeat